MKLNKKHLLFGLFLSSGVTLAFAFSAGILNVNANEAPKPEITDVDIPFAFPADGIMTIQVSGLSHEDNENTVFLDETQLSADEVRSSQNEIDVILSSGLTGGDLTVVVQGTSSDPYPISFGAPIVDSISFPNGPEPEEEFKIHGSNFYTTQGGNEVSILDSNNGTLYELNVVSASESEIIAELPDTVFQGILTVEKEGWVSTGDEIEMLIIPEIYSIEYPGNDLEFGEELTIKGKYFHEDLTENIVVFDDNDGDIEEGIEVTPFFVDETDLKTIKVMVPDTAESGQLHVEIRDYESNKVDYELKQGPIISFDDNKADLDPDTGHVLLSVNSPDFSPVVSQNEFYSNGALATVIGEIANNVIRVDFGLPEPSGVIYAQTNGYKGNELEYDFSRLLVPKVTKLETISGFYPGSVITLTGINFTDDTILGKGDEYNELTLEDPERNEMKAIISGEATLGQKITFQLRNGFYSGNEVTIVVGDSRAEIEILVEEQTEVEQSDSTQEEEDDSDPEVLVTYFSDVKTSDWFALEVASLFERGVISGKDDGLYHPGDQTSRAEFLKMAFESKGTNITLVETTAFTDINGHWAQDYIKFAESAGIIASQPQFRPNQPITRAEALKILLEVFKINETDVSSEYFEDTLTHWSVFYAAKGFELGVVEGELSQDGKRYFHPDRDLNRAEAAKIIFEMVE